MPPRRMKPMKPLVAMLIIAGSFTFARADDFTGGNLECWDDSRRQDITCIELTDKFLMSLRFATRAQIQTAMNATGRPGEAPGVSFLHFISNYSRGAKY